MRLLLDTCALFYLAWGREIRPGAREQIEDAASTDDLLVSVVSAWEIGLLSSPDRRSPLRFDPDPLTWFRRAVAQPGVRLQSITPEIAIRSAHLEPAPHKDPADRLLIATALWLGVPIVTSDRLLLGYAAESALKVVAC